MNELVTGIIFSLFEQVLDIFIQCIDTKKKRKYKYQSEIKEIFFYLCSYNSSFSCCQQRSKCQSSGLLQKNGNPYISEHRNINKCHDIHSANIFGKSASADCALLKILAHVFGLL